VATSARCGRWRPGRCPRHPGHRQRQLRPHGAGVAAGRRRHGRGATARPNGLWGGRWRSGALPDGTRVIVSGSYDGTVRLWRLAPRSRLRWTYPTRYGMSSFTVTSSSLPRGPASPSTNQRPCEPFVHQTTMPGEHLGTGGQLCATRARYPVHRSGMSASQTPVQSADPTVGPAPDNPGRGLLHSGKVKMCHCRRQAHLGDHSWLFWGLEPARGRAVARASIRQSCLWGSMMTVGRSTSRCMVCLKTTSEHAD